MINHARTLLLNQPRQRMHPTDVGHAYVPPAFQSIKLPPPLLAIRNILFGATPDNYFLNYRVRELLTYIHQTELAEFVYQFDPRVTYWPETSTPFFESSSKRVTITQTYGAPSRLTIAGDLFAQPEIGRATHTYLTRLLSDATTNTLRVDVQHLGQRTPAALQTAQIFDPADPPVISLAQTNLNLRVNVAGTPTTYGRILTETNGILLVESYAPESGGRLLLETPSFNLSSSPLSLRLPNTEAQTLQAQWLVETKANPAAIISTAFPALEMLGEPVFLELFGVTADEPYQTFKNLWFDHPFPAYRLSGLVLALIYRTESLRK